MNKENPPNENVLPFMRKHNNISPAGLDDILEDLQDMGCLSTKGDALRTALWEMFVKE